MFAVDIDVSYIWFGGVVTNAKQMEVTAYYSKMLNKTEKTYCITQREVLTI
jgi:hypothetical protein